MLSQGYVMGRLRGPAAGVTAAAGLSAGRQGPARRDRRCDVKGWGRLGQQRRAAASLRRVGVLSRADSEAVERVSQLLTTGTNSGMSF